jgi:hypothetical protein
MDLLSGSNLKQAQAYWAAVEAACSSTNPDAANGPLMIYINYLRGLYPASFLTPKTGTAGDLFVAHIDTVFGYVGYPAPGLTTNILDNYLTGVILPTGGTREYILEHVGAFKLAVQDANGDQRGHLFAMYPLNAQCLSVDNLQELASCYELSVYPTVSPKFSPVIQVGICISETIKNAGLSLGHEVGGKTEVAGQIAYPTSCHPAESGSWTGGPREILKRLAYTLGVRPAYGFDAGIGGFGSLASPFGALDAQIFAAEFGGPENVVGSPPDTVNGNYHFTMSVTPPGSILVQSSLGNLTGPLVVLSQGGGNCEACGGLQLTAKFYSVSDSAANDGVNEVNWTSVQASPGVKGAPFVVRGQAGRKIATLTYKTLTTGNALFYNDTIPVGTWTRNVSQTFKILVDLNNDRTSLFINGTAVSNATSRAFQDVLASSLATLGAEFNGIDSGVMGWDAIGVRRVADQSPPST